MAKQVEALSDAELRQELQSFGKNVGPVTGTTRNVYAKMLQNLRASAKPGGTSKSVAAPSKSPAAVKRPVGRPRKSPARRTNLSESEDGSDNESVSTSTRANKPLVSTPTSTPPKRDRSDERRGNYSPANSILPGLRTGLPTVEDRPGATPPRKRAPSVRTPKFESRPVPSSVSQKRGESSFGTSLSSGSKVQPSSGSTGSAYRSPYGRPTVAPGDTSADDSSDDHEEGTRIVSSTWSSSPPKKSSSSLGNFLTGIRSPFSKNTPELSIGRDPASSYEMRVGGTRTRVERDLKTGAVHVKKTVNNDVSSLLIITLSIFFVIIASLYIYSSNPGAVKSTASSAIGLVSDFFKFLYTYAILPLAIVLILAAVVIGVYFAHKKYQASLAKEEEEFFDLVDKIISIVRESSEDGEEYVSVPHVRDKLFPPSQRRGSSLARWERAVNYVNENESRVGTETRVLRGAECQVWKWIPPTRSGWQGAAFSQKSSAENIPKVALSRCLKLREMFKEGTANAAEIETQLRAKLDNIRPVHIHVDSASKEGVVFLRFASFDDARRAFLALHGAWFNGGLVSAKYLRDERYSERFPETALF